jgi:spore germination protein
MRLSKIKLTAIALCFCAGVLGSAQAEPDNLKLQSWAVYWDWPRSMAQADQLGGRLQNVGLFCYQFDLRGHIIPGSDALGGGLAALKALPAKPGIWISVTNDLGTGKTRRLKDPAVVHRTLASGGRRRAHVRELLALAAGTAGIEIDYENLWKRDRANFVSFISELADALHQRSQRLSVVVQPKLNDAVKDGAGAMDWPALANVADEIKVMAYHEHHARSGPGPLCSPEWLSRLVQFAQTQIPSNKLVVVLTVGGFDWPAKGIATGIDYARAQSLVALHQSKIVRDEPSQSPHFSYTSGSSRHEVWFEDAHSLRSNIDLLMKSGVLGVALWRLGAADPNLFTALP